MQIFEWIVALLLIAVALSAIARKVSIPYPTLLALCGAGLALSSRAPPFSLDPELALVLFVAPVLLDSAFDTSLRDLRDNWLSIGCLVIVAVGITTIATAMVSRALVPDLGWAPAIALGAIVAPPDAAAATAVLKQMRPPHRIMMILEGESLLNDASALIVYRLAVGAAAAGFTAKAVAPAFALGLVGSLIVGPLCGWLVVKVLGRIRDVPSAIIMQFVSTFAMWMLAEALHLSAVLTLVVYAMTISRLVHQPARMRVPSYAVWETTVFVLNVLAFLFIGLQLGPIVTNLDGPTRNHYFLVAGAVLATVIAARLLWVFFYVSLTSMLWRTPSRSRPSFRGGVIVGWCGMRGIVTLATAFALPGDFPYRNLLVFCAFGVVVGTLVIQGLTLPLLLRFIPFKDEDPVAKEITEGRRAAYEAAMKAIDGDQGASAEAVKQEIRDILERNRQGNTGEHAPTIASLRRKASDAARATTDELRRTNVIGDNAYHKLEEELDWAELNSAE